MTTIKELHRDRRIVSQNRGRAIAAELDFSEPFTDAQAADIAAVDNLMTQHGLRGAKEGVARWRQGEGFAPNPVQGFTEQVEQQGTSTSQQHQQSTVQALDTAAQNEAAGILTTKNLLVAHYLAQGSVPDPALQGQVDKSGQLVETVLLRSVPAFSVGNLIQAATSLGPTLPTTSYEALPEATQTS